MSLQAVNVAPNVILVSVLCQFSLSLIFCLPVSLPLPLPNKRISIGLTAGYIIALIFELPGSFPWQHFECAYYALKYKNSYSLE